MPSLFGLAPGGVCHAASVAGRAVRSYRTLSPLPRAEARGGLLSVALSLGSPPPGVTRHRHSVEPGLSSPPSCDEAAAAQPSGAGAIDANAGSVIPLRPGQQQREQDRAAFAVNLAIDQFGTEAALERNDCCHRICNFISKPL
jgi:hypothetical protein